ncbi:hypothetical protein CIB84_013846, partial [Bambusicola thoracicus]
GAISENDIKILVTATTVSFNLSTTTKEFAVSVSLNDSSQIIQKNNGFFVWNDLTPGTLYTFEFIFHQLHLEFINVSQSLEVQAETGIYYFVVVTINVRKSCLLLRRIKRNLQSLYSIMQFSVRCVLFHFWKE